MEKFEQEPLHGDGRPMITGPSKYIQGVKQTLGFGGIMRPAMKTNNLDEKDGHEYHSKILQNPTKKLNPTRSSSGQLQPRMLRPIRPKMEKKAGPRMPAPGQYPQHGSHSVGMVRNPRPSPVRGRGLSGIVPSGVSHRRALSFPQPQINYRQNACALVPQSNVSHYPTKTALGESSNMSTSVSRMQSPPSASNSSEWNLPPGISISRIKQSSPGSGMTVTSLASALHMLGERTGIKRMVSYRLTEKQILALKTLGFEQEYDEV